MDGQISYQRFVFVVLVHLITNLIFATGKSTEWAEHSPHHDSDDAASNDSASHSDSKEQEEEEDEQTVCGSKIGKFGREQGPHATTINGLIPGRWHGSSRSAQSRKICRSQTSLVHSSIIEFAAQSDSHPPATTMKYSFQTL